MIAPLIAAVIASLIAGHPVQVACDIPESAIIAGWTQPPTVTTTIHLKGSLCAVLDGPVTVPLFSIAVGTLAHESAHQRGIQDEACATLWESIALFPILNRFYGEHYGSANSWYVYRMDQLSIMAEPSQYHWTLSSCSPEQAPGPDPLGWPVGGM